MDHLLVLALVGVIIALASDRGTAGLKSLAGQTVAIGRGGAAQVGYVARWYVRVALGQSSER